MMEKIKKNRWNFFILGQIRIQINMKQIHNYAYYMYVFGQVKFLFFFLRLNIHIYLTSDHRRYLFDTELHI